MAKIILATPAADIRGKLGGIVFSRNTWGPYIRLKTSPVQPQTSRQVSIRAMMTTLTQYWRDTMTQAQRNAWSYYATETNKLTGLGATNPMNGLIAFVRWNVEQMAQGNTMLTAAPSLPGLATMLMATTTGDVANGVKITALSPAPAATDYVEVYSNLALLPRSINFFNGPWYHQLHNLGNTALPWTVIGPGAPVIGQRYFMRIRVYTANGKVGAPAICHQDITS